jgi:hypothetical protein
MLRHIYIHLLVTGKFNLISCVFWGLFSLNKINSNKRVVRSEVTKTLVFVICIQSTQNCQHKVSQPPAPSWNFIKLVQIPTTPPSESCSCSKFTKLNIRNLCFMCISSSQLIIIKINSLLCDGGSHTTHENRQTEFTLHSSVSWSDFLGKFNR